MNQKVQLRQRQEWDVLSDKLLLSIRVSEVTLDRVSDYTVTTSYKFIDAYVRKISVKSNESDVRMNDVCGIFGGGGRGVYNDAFRAILLPEKNTHYQIFILVCHRLGYLTLRGNLQSAGATTFNVNHQETKTFV